MNTVTFKHTTLCFQCTAIEKQNLALETHLFPKVNTQTFKVNLQRDIETETDTPQKHISTVFGAKHCEQH